MSKYTIDYGTARFDDESNGILITINEPVLMGDSYDGELSIDQETNSVWMHSSFDIDELSWKAESDNWFREMFKEHSSVKGCLRRQLINANR